MPCNGVRNSILVVDDQLGVCRLLYEAFSEDGFQVRTAASGQEAIEQVKETLPDLILMDMKMPGMNGLETLYEIRQISQDVAVVIMTAYGELEVVTEALKLGAKEYITKPFDLDKLKTLVRQVLAGTYRRPRKAETA